MQDSPTERVLKAHKAFVDRIHEQLKRSPASDSASEAARTESEELLARNKTRLRATVAEKEKMIRRFDEEISRRKLMVARLETELREAKKARRDINASSAEATRRDGQRHRKHGKK
jgi:hypothetical protein